MTEVAWSPPVSTDDEGMRDITGSSVIVVGQQLAFTVHGVDAEAVYARAAEQEIEFAPSAIADHHGIRHITGGSVVAIGVQGAGVRVDISSPPNSQSSVFRSIPKSFRIDVPRIRGFRYSRRRG